MNFQDSENYSTNMSDIDLHSNIMGRPIVSFQFLSFLLCVCVCEENLWIWHLKTKESRMKIMTKWFFRGFCFRFSIFFCVFYTHSLKMGIKVEKPQLNFILISRIRMEFFDLAHFFSIGNVFFLSYFHVQYAKCVTV